MIINVILKEQKQTIHNEVTQLKNFCYKSQESYYDGDDNNWLLLLQVIFKMILKTYTKYICNTCPRCGSRRKLRPPTKTST